MSQQDRCQWCGKKKLAFLGLIRLLDRTISTYQCTKCKMVDLQQTNKTGS